MCVPAACTRRPHGAPGDLTALLLLRSYAVPTVLRSSWEREATVHTLCIRPRGVQWRCHGDAFKGIITLTVPLILYRADNVHNRLIAPLRLPTGRPNKDNYKLINFHKQCKGVFDSMRERNCKFQCFVQLDFADILWMCNWEFCNDFLKIEMVCKHSLAISWHILKRTNLSDTVCLYVENGSGLMTFLMRFNQWFVT